MEYSGPERRRLIEDDGVVKTGRRSGDEHCGQHDILWRHHDEDTRNHRSIVCGKIKGVDDEVDELRKDVKELAKSTTPWKVFALSMVLVIGSIGGSIAWLAGYIDKGQTEIKTSVSAIHQRISTNDKEDDATMRGVTDSLRDLNYSVQSIDSRLKTVEKFVEAKPK